MMSTTILILAILLSTIGIMSWIQVWINTINTEQGQDNSPSIIIILLASTFWGIFYYITH